MASAGSRVTIESNGGSGIGTNSLNIIALSDLENATGRHQSATSSTRWAQQVVFSEFTDSVDAHVRRTDPNAAFRVAFTVIDDCNGPFYTKPFGGPAQPTPTPTLTSTRHADTVGRSRAADCGDARLDRLRERCATIGRPGRRGTRPA